MADHLSLHGIDSLGTSSARTIKWGRRDQSWRISVYIIMVCNRLQVIFQQTAVNNSFTRARCGRFCRRQSKSHIPEDLSFLTLPKSRTRRAGKPFFFFLPGDLRPYLPILPCHEIIMR